MSGAEQTSRGGVGAEQLNKLSLFHGVDLATVEPLMADCDVRELEAGEVLIGAGEPNRHLYLILAGRLGVYLGSVDSESIATIEAGETVGEVALIDGQPASAHVLALTPSRAVMVDEELLWLLVDTSHAVSSNLLHLLARRLRSGNRIIHEDREQLREYRFHASVDALTGIFNRYWLNKMLPRQIQRARMNSEPLSALMIDIDHFKQYNDRFGHVGGDVALASVAAALRELLRPSDLCARYGGEEFFVLLPTADIGQARATAKRLCRAIPKVAITRSDGTPLAPVTLSIGVGQLADGQTPEDFVEACDRKLYAAKMDGRNRVRG